MLADILASTRRRLPEVVARSDEIRRRASAVPPPRSFAAAVRAPGLTVIAEVKRRSPSRGDLAPDLNPVTQAQAYAAGGAGAISVLTEPEFFSGSGDDLVEVATTIALPVLRKDFIVHPIQVWEAAGWGAAAVLLIVAALDDVTLAGLLTVADEAGIGAVVEVHDEDEARRAEAAGAAIVGVNNRNLADFSVDLATAELVANILDDDTLTIAESGIFTGADAARMAAAGYDAVLVGEALVRSADPAVLVAELKDRA